MTAAGQVERIRVDELAQRYREPLRRWFMRRGLDGEAAEDGVQETFARLCARVESVERPEGYLFAVAASVLTDRARRARARRERDHLPLDDFDAASEEPNASRVFEGKEAVRRLGIVLSALPPRTREMFLLNRLDRLSYTQLAVRYGISLSAVEKHMMRAIAHLHRNWSNDG